MNNPEIDDFGTKYWKDYQQLLHRDGDLPAWISCCGSKYWWFHGKIHRTFGPSTEDYITWNWLDKVIKDE